MRHSKDLSVLAVAFLLVGSAAALLSLVALRAVAYELLQIIMIVAGSTFFSGFALLLSFARQPRSASVTQISFQGDHLHARLEEVIEADFREVSRFESHPWVPTPERLFNEDPILALAKIRIDLEEEVRRIGIMVGAIRPDQRFDLLRTLSVVERRSIIPATVVEAIRTILPLCNRALHGEAIDLVTVKGVIDIAREIMTVLQSK